MQKMSDIEIKFHSNGDSARNHPLYPGFKPQTILYKRNTAIKDGALDLPCAITKEQDVAVKLRDNTTIYVDVLRPTDIAYPLPAIISWGPFGKNGGFNRQVLNDSPWRSGVPQRTVSGLENFEGLDPAYWCNHG
jgi:predicted acyl esterase